MTDYAEETGPDEVRLERLLPGPIDRVWAYLVDGEKRRTWLAGGDIEERVGASFKLHFKHSELSAEPARTEGQQYEGRHPGTVLAVDKPHRLTISWSETEDGSDPTPSEVTFDLAEQGDRVRLVVTHRKLASREDKKDVSMGWHAHLGVLEDRLGGREPRFFWQYLSSLKPAYDERYPGVKDFWDRQEEKT